MYKDLILLTLVACFIWATPAFAISFPSNGQPVVPSRATSVFIVAGSQCDAQRSNMGDYFLLYKTSNSMCENQAVYIQEKYFKAGIGFFAALMFAIVIVFVLKRKRDR